LIVFRPTITRRSGRANPAIAQVRRRPGHLVRCERRGGRQKMLERAFARGAQYDYSMLERITVTLPKDLLKQADRIAKRRGVESRSALVVQALTELVTAERSRAVDADLDAYYGSLSKAEQDEERAMVRAFRRSRRKLDVDREGK